MNFFRNNKKLTLFFIILLVIGAIIVGSSIGSNKFLTIKEAIPKPIKNLLKKTIFIIPELNKKNKALVAYANKIHRDFIELRNMTSLNGSQYANKNINSSQNKEEKYNLKKYILKKNLIENETHLLQPNKQPAGYISHKDNLIIITTGKGSIFFIDKLQIKDQKNINLDLEPIPNNIESYFKHDKLFYDFYHVGVRDTLINDGYLYLSYNKLQSKDCYNISILRSKINNNFLNFENFFSYDECIETNKVQKFYINQSGGRIVKYLDDKILFSTGSMRAYYNDENAKKIVEQDENSKFGKILLIDIKTKKSEIFSLGHRNPQGLIFLSKNNTILSTEHGAIGGDEINLIKKGKNYGWPIASYSLGHYDGTYKVNAPLLKPHSKYGFEEPLKYWTPAIGISQLEENINKENSVLIASMRDETIHDIEFDYNYEKIIGENEIFIGQRIRDISSDKELNLYYLILENPSSLAILQKN